MPSILLKQHGKKVVGDLGQIGKKALHFTFIHWANLPHSADFAWIFERKNTGKPGNFYICDVAKGHDIAAHMLTEITNSLFTMLLEQYRLQGVRLIFRVSGKWKWDCSAKWIQKRWGPPQVIIPVFHSFGVSGNPTSVRLPHVLVLTSKYEAHLLLCGVSKFSFAGCNINSRHFLGFGHGDFLLLNSEYAKPIILLSWPSIIINDFVRQFFSTEVILIHEFASVLIIIVHKNRFRK